MLLTGSLPLLAQLAFSYNSEVALPTAAEPSHIVINNPSGQADGGIPQLRFLLPWVTLVCVRVTKINQHQC